MNNWHYRTTRLQKARDSSVDEWTRQTAEQLDKEFRVNLVTPTVLGGRRALETCRILQIIQNVFSKWNNIVKRLHYQYIYRSKVIHMVFADEAKRHMERKLQDTNDYMQWVSGNVS